MLLFIKSERITVNNNNKLSHFLLCHHTPPQTSRLCAGWHQAPANVRYWMMAATKREREKTTKWSSISVLIFTQHSFLRYFSSVMIFWGTLAVITTYRVPDYFSFPFPASLSLLWSISTAVDETWRRKCRCRINVDKVIQILLWFNP